MSLQLLCWTPTALLLVQLLAIQPAAWMLLINLQNVCICQRISSIQHMCDQSMHCPAACRMLHVTHQHSCICLCLGLGPCVQEELLAPLLSFLQSEIDRKSAAACMEQHQQEQLLPQQHPPVIPGAVALCAHRSGRSCPGSMARSRHRRARIAAR